MPSKVVYASWGDALRGYAAEKKRLPWAEAHYAPDMYKNRRVTKAEVSLKEREFNPVTMRFRNATREEGQADKERERLSKLRKDARLKQIIMGQRWNIISNEVFPDAPARPVRPTPARHPDSNAKYNIVNNVPHHKHQTLKLLTAEGTVYTPTPRQVLIDGGKKPVSHFKREFDVINNRYHQKHEDRVAQDEAKLREDSQRKYWRTHDYNLVVGSYYDREKEREYLERRFEVAELHGKAKREREPPSYKFSEGHAFDVVNNRVKDEGKSELIVNAGLKGIKAKKKNIIEKAQRDRAVKMYETWELKRTNRVCSERYEPEIRRGYNLITNAAFEGEGRAAHPPHRARVRPSQWTRLKTCGLTNRASSTSSTAPAPTKSLVLKAGEVGGGGDDNNHNNNQRAAAWEDEVKRAAAMASSSSPAVVPRAQTSGPLVATTRESARSARSGRYQQRQKHILVPPLAIQQAAAQQQQPQQTA